ncbi:hypothetical protein [Peribacillus tepidiphilus]|uniref:hypothetical protein n=1 Tax=Peribacillus tepidiphilus TaxID=2652445 RepID=UPI001290E70A|nr:hypothetical protein [Peribacillus tepidiphilus]
MHQAFSNEQLLQAYLQIWNNRGIQSEDDAGTVLKELIKRELLDENSHPRVRKNKYEKFYLSVKRLAESSLHPEEKVALLAFYISTMQDLQN